MTERSSTRKACQFPLHVLIEALETRKLLSAPWSTQDQQINLNEARANFPSITGTGETVAIIDEGTDYNNPDLGGGYGKVVIDSYNFDNNSWDVMPYDNNAHGTGTSGQIAGQPHVYNGQLYEGVAPGVKIIALRANGTTETKEALDFIEANRTKYNIVAVNYLDFTGSVNETQILPELQTLTNDGVFIAGAVGNYGPSTAYAHIDHLIVNVGSVNSSDQLSSFTPRGANLDFVAPGENVIISWYSNGKSMDYPSDGTSWAGPQVTATGALIKQIDPAFTDAQIYSIIHDSAHWVYDSYSNRSYAMLDVNAALGLAYQRAGKAGGTTTKTAPAPTPTPPAPTPAPAPKSTSNNPLPSLSSYKGTPFLKSSFTTGEAIYAADYDNGGAGVAYADTSPTDQGGDAGYRTGGVDIGYSSPNRAAYVGWTHSGEWMNYTIDATSTGTYNVLTRLSSSTGGGTFHIDIDGKAVTGEISVADTGSWDKFANTTASGISLTAGKHVMSVVMDSQGKTGFVADFEDFALDKAAATVVAKPAIVNVSVPNAPFNLTVSTASGGSLILDWIDNSTNETGFFIERSTSPTGTFVRVATVLASTKTSRGTGGRSYIDTSLTPGTTYYYRVVAVNTKGMSSPAAASGTTSTVTASTRERRT
jgi:hypothetical protein